MPEAQKLFRSAFGYLPVHVVRSQAVVELVGAGVGRDHGLTVAATLDCGVEIACAPRKDGKCRLLFSGDKQAVIFRPDQLEKDPSAARADFLKATMGVLQNRRVSLRGFDALFHDDIPVGSGLNRFPPTGLAMMLALRALFPFQLVPGGKVPHQASDAKHALLTKDERWAAADICREAERMFLGADISGTEHVAALFSRAWHVSLIDQTFRSCQTLPLLGTVLILSFPATSLARPAAEALCSLRGRLADAARKLGLKSLRTADLGLLKANRQKLSHAEYSAAHLVVLETAAAVASERALLAEDYRQFGQFVTQASLNEGEMAGPTASGNQVLLQAGLADAACFGGRRVPWSRSGVLHLVSHHQADGFVTRLRDAYTAQTGSSCTCRVFQLPERTV